MVTHLVNGGRQCLDAFARFADRPGLLRGGGFLAASAPRSPGDDGDEHPFLVIGNVGLNFIDSKNEIGHWVYFNDDDLIIFFISDTSYFVGREAVSVVI